jgi:hypothetical protein
MEHRKEGEEFKSSTVEYGQHSPETSTNHYAPVEEQKEPSKFKRHCQRFWWLHLINFVLGTLIISLLLYVLGFTLFYPQTNTPRPDTHSCNGGASGCQEELHADLRKRTYVMLPAIAQKQIDDAKMAIETQIVSNPKPDEVTLHIVSRITTGSIFRPDLDAFTASLFMEETEPNIKVFGQITIPQTHATKNFTQTVTQRMKILDMDEFIKYNIKVLSAKSFRLGVRGRTKLHLGAFPVNPIDFNKAPDLQGKPNRDYFSCNILT